MRARGACAAATASLLLVAGCGADDESADTAGACGRPTGAVVSGPFCFNVAGLEARLRVSCDTRVEKLTEGSPLPVAARRCTTPGGSSFDAVVYRDAREAQSAHRQILTELGLGDTAATWALVYNVLAITRENRAMRGAVRSLRNRPKTRLRIVVRPEGAGGPVKRRTIVCDATTVTEDCRRLEETDPALFEPPEPGQVCTEIYGGPATATVDGVLRGEKVRARFDRRNGCTIERWDRLERLLG